MGGVVFGISALYPEMYARHMYKKLCPAEKHSLLTLLRIDRGAPLVFHLRISLEGRGFPWCNRF